MAFAHTTRGRGGVQKFFNGLVSGQSFLGKFFTHAASLNDGALSQGRSSLRAGRPTAPSRYDLSQLSSV